MQKYILLTSLLALTACGGGHGGGNVPNKINTTVNYVDTVGESNALVTGMVSNSEYQVARYVATKLGSDADSVNLSRSAFVPKPLTGNTDYDTARELVDLATWLANDTTTENDIVFLFNKSNIDKNKIKAALKLIDNMYCFVGGSAEKTAERIIQNRANFATPLADLQQKTEVFDMNDIEFVMAAASGSGGDEGGAKDLITFELDNTGQIIAVNHQALIKNGDNLELSESESATFSRNKDTNNNYKDNSFDVGQINGEGKVYTGNGIVLTYGKDMGLKYSDFGQFKYDLTWTKNDESGTEKSYEPFAGGYKELRKDLPENAMTFNGKAAGAVSNNGLNKNIVGSATLSFNGETETLNMIFSNTPTTEDNIPWYDVKIIRKQSDNTNSIEFTTNDELNQNIPDNLKFADFESDNTRTKNNYLTDGYNGGEYGHDHTPGIGHGKIDIGYYGSRNETINEFTGVTQYVESLNGINAGEIRMNVGFGGKKAE